MLLFILFSTEENSGSVKAESSSVSNIVSIGSMATDSDAISKEIVASCDQVVSCDHAVGILWSNEKYEGEGEEDNSYNNVSTEDD